MSPESQEPDFGMAARIGLSLISFLAILGFGLAFMTTPDPRGFGTHEQFGLPPCTFQTVFGIPCPSCGGTTSLSHFVRGNWIQSCRCNAATFVGALSGLLLVPWSIISSLRGRWFLIHNPFKSLLILLTVISLVAVLQWSFRVIGH
jgi:Protein of unknown function (DUF2752).